VRFFTWYTVNITYLPRWRVAGISEESSIITKFQRCLKIEDLKTAKGEDSEGNAVDVVVSFTGKIS
jgi:hypothetical protein